MPTLVESIKEMLAGGAKTLTGPPVTEFPRADWPPAPYSRTEVWRLIQREAGQNLATDRERAKLLYLQLEHERWTKAEHFDPEGHRRTLWLEWERAVAAGESYAPEGPLSDRELTRRKDFIMGACSPHRERICREARPLVIAILQRLPALAKSLLATAERDEQPERERAQKRGMTYVPSTWYRQLVQTPEEVQAWLAELERQRYASPGSAPPCQGSV